ncbi:MAG TPA: aspartate aminotransferase family protein [Gemmatimonadaceae bacterium]|nr:aspartate aminotransferase family protein [Gemmatimonadaceae bacterium]
MTTHGFPETHVLFRKLTSRLPVIERGEGCWLYEADGTAYLDACGGAYVVNVGHGVAEIADAMAEQARRLAYVSGMAFSHDPVEELAAELAALTPGDLDKVYPLSSGSDAIEAALKLTRQYWLESGRPRKYKVIALSPAYHGNTLLALSASAREHYRRIYGDWLVDVVRIPAPYAYRCGCGGIRPYCSACSGAALEEAIVREDPETVAAFIAEPVGGSSTGGSVPPPDYFHHVRQICDRHDVLFVADEVLVGAGRTGTWSALAPSGVVPDVIVFGKGIAGGYAPLAAVVVPTRLADVFARGSGAFNHAQTFSHHPVLCAAGVATIRYLRTHRLVERCAEMGPVLHRRLARLRELPHVGDVRGRGLLAGVELVDDKDTRAPFPREARVAERLTAAALDLGLVVWPNVGHADGTRGDLVMVAPPFIITEEEIALIAERLEAAMVATGLTTKAVPSRGLAAR